MNKNPSFRYNLLPFFYRITALLVCAALLLSGCTISPQPLTSQEIEARAVNDLAMMQVGQEEVTDKPISLYEAMARALKYNLDQKVKVMEEALAVQQLDISRYDLLPQITASAGYNVRNNYEGSYSQSLIDGSQSLVASTSREKNYRTADISIMWNVLDFGVSYARAKQQANRVLIIEERRRKVIQNILQDVRYAYWRAVSSERLINDMVLLLNKTKQALKQSRQVAELRLQSPRESLEYQKALLENIRLLWNIIQNLTPAKVELASLMNLPPGTKFNLTEEDWRFPTIPSFTLPVDKLEQMALISRPELREEDYKTRISAGEVRKSLLQMLPSLNLTLDSSYDDNNFLYNNSWWDAGTLVSQNIVKLFSGPKSIKAAKTQQGIEDIRRQAVSMAVMVQVNLAYQKYGLAKKEYFVSRHLENISQQIKQQISAEQSVGRASELEAIKSETNAMIAKMRHYNTYSGLQRAVGRIYNSLGIDLLPKQVESDDITTLAAAIKDSIAEWQQQVNPKDIAHAGQQSVMPLFDSGLDINDIMGQDQPVALAQIAHQSQVPSFGLESLLTDNNNYANIKNKHDNYTRTSVILRKHKLSENVVAEQEEPDNADEQPADRTIIRIHSASQANDIFRRRLLNDLPDSPVQVKLKSATHKAVSWYRKDSIDRSLNSSVEIRLHSPLKFNKL